MAVNSQTQMMSSACQNRAKHRRRRSTAGRNPLTATCAISTANQISPAVTCNPWQPTTVKNAERKALRCGVETALALVLGDCKFSDQGPADETRCTGDEYARHDVPRGELATIDPTLTAIKK